MNRLYVLSLAILSLISCNNQLPFEKDKWKLPGDAEMPNEWRKRMIKDLMTNYELKGMKRAEIINLLGAPDFIDSSSLSYKVIVEYEYLGVDPIYSKILDISVSKDSTITSVKVIE
jgi:hypothetical protein